MSESEPGPVGVRPRILVGVDGSADGLRAVMYAMRHAMADGADVWVVHVVDDEAPVGGLWELVSTPAGLRKLGQAKLDEAVGVLSAEGFPRERVVAELPDGRPGDTLVNHSERAELMVTGRRSISGLARLFVGSTSVEAATHASCPVVVISAASTPHRTGGLRSVAVAVSSWPAHQAALEWVSVRRCCARPGFASFTLSPRLWVLREQHSWPRLRPALTVSFCRFDRSIQKRPSMSR